MTAKIMPIEKRQKIHRKATGKCADMLREAGAKFAYMVVMIPAGNSDEVHIIDAYSGETIPDMPGFLTMLASAHRAQDTDVSSGDIGRRQ